MSGCLVSKSSTPGPLPLAGLGSHVPALDGVRGIAVLGVMLAHFCLGVCAVGGPLGTLVITTNRIGRVGVELFFVLSGFLITGILLDAKQTPNYFRNFYMRRVLRIFPLYYVTLALFFLLAPLAPFYNHRDVANAINNQSWYWLYSVNFLIAFKQEWGCSYLSHFWSLAIEEHFYLIWPLVVFWTSPRRLGRICLALVIGSLALRWGLREIMGNYFAARMATFARVDSLAIGALVALIARRGGGLADWKSAARIALPLCGAAYVAVMFLFNTPDGWDSNPGWILAGITLLSLAFAAFLVLAILTPRASFLGWIVNHGFLRMLGKYSYALYVFHEIIRPIVTTYLPLEVLQPRFGGLLAVLIHVGVGLGITLALAIASWHLFEKHFLKLKRFFEYRRQPAPAAAVRSSKRAQSDPRDEPEVAVAS